MSGFPELPLSQNERSEIVLGAFAQEALDRWIRGEEIEDIASDPEFIEHTRALFEGNMSDEERTETLERESVRDVTDMFEQIRQKLVNDGDLPEEADKKIRGMILKSVLGIEIACSQYGDKKEK